MTSDKIGRPMHEFQEFSGILKRWHTWLRLRRSMTWGLQGLIFGLGISLGFSSILVWNQALLPQEFVRIILLAALGSMLVLGLVAFLWPTSNLNLARFYDNYFFLQERASTALEIHNGGAIQPEDEVLQRQLTDTLQASRRVSPDWHFFVQVRRGQGLVILSLVAVMLLVLFLGKPSFQKVIQQRLMRDAVQKEIENLENLIEQVQSNPSLAEQQQQELAQPLQQALQDLKKAQSMEQAVSVLTRAAEQIQPLTDAQAQRKAEGLQNAGTQLSQAPNSPLQGFGQNLAEGNFQTSAQELQNLAGELANMTPEELAALAEQLDQAAATLEDSSPDLANALRQAAEALRRGDVQSAQQALEQAAQNLSQSGWQIAQSQAAGQIAAQLSQGGQRVIQAGQSAQSGQNQTQGQAQGQGQGSGQGQGTGEGQAGNQGQGQSQGGAGKGEGGGDSGVGPEAGSNPIDQNNGPGDGGQSSYEQIYAPQRLGGAGGDEVNLPGSGSPGDQTIRQGNTAPGEPGSSSVPYVDVFPSYAEAFRQAIDNGEVPASLRELVKKYFSSLEP